jgi:hypothetical protein
MAQAVVAPTTTVSDRAWTVSDLEATALPGRLELVDGVLYMERDARVASRAGPGQSG